MQLRFMTLSSLSRVLGRGPRVCLYKRSYEKLREATSRRWISCVNRKHVSAVEASAVVLPTWNPTCQPSLPLHQSSPSAKRLGEPLSLVASTICWPAELVSQLGTAPRTAAADILANTLLKKTLVDSSLPKKHLECDSELFASYPTTTQHLGSPATFLSARLLFR